MDNSMIERLLTTVDLINTNLDTSPDSWQDQLPAIQNITASFEINDTVPDEARRHWQVPLISVFQRVAFVDADHGAVKDLADCNWPQLVTASAKGFVKHLSGGEGIFEQRNEQHWIGNKGFG
ncbi:hypothetical protein J4E86_004935 [Alternaria arbusti]|uniref:uncharacterized protein n=1 Tax=Alternaria arbusti TaxID=232088 RepID=UPI00221F86F0|nr:uncharacterized protein J4E86_004935 [Alternaria arbusti]KAI4957796.1 hypothetical protein J4E86_004935 [Alternaria arbusti]